MRGRGFTLAELGLIRTIIMRMQSKNRLAIAREICIQLNWRHPSGQLKEAACWEVLLKLHRAGLIALPHPRTLPPPRRPVPPSSQTAPPFPITISVGKLGEIELIRVTPKSYDSRLFREYLDRYHYLGCPAIVGHQLRYFIRCHKGLLGCIAFGAAAWSVKPRDQWIGWDHMTRQRNLHYVVNNVRFLILPWVKSPNLPSCILGLCARQVPEDWQRHYSYRPLLFETFVEKDRFQGTSYKAANWIYVGDTQGRGKNDRFTQHLFPIKAIYLYPLEKNACLRLLQVNPLPPHHSP